ncbi:TIGR02391 family protein [Pimelobacter simplex]|uniref:TIGR02391 family protein n=1 Tax=Nocardioides simplex TaxID=2045 RepID=UPI00366EB742
MQQLGDLVHVEEVELIADDRRAELVCDRERQMLDLSPIHGDKLGGRCRTPECPSARLPNASRLSVSVTDVDVDWCLAELRKMIELLHYKAEVGLGGVYYTMSSNDEVLHAQAHVVDQILDVTTPEWRKHLPADPKAGKPPWKHHRTWATRAIAALSRQQEVEERLGPVAPTISVNQLHPWVWDSAAVAWSAGSYGDAVRAAARGLNAKARQKLDRRDIGEWKLLMNAFLTKDPSEGEPRLRLMENDGSDTFTSLHEGAGALAKGLFQAVRNPANHEDDEEDVDELLAVERLAAFSLLARLVDGAEVARADDE